MEEINNNVVSPPVIKSPSSFKIPFLVVFIVLMMVLSSLVTYLILKSPAPVQISVPVVQTSPTTIVQPTPTSLPDETANWKTYNNNGMTFKYPSGWMLDDTTNIISSILPKIILVAVPKGNTLMNECMDMVSVNAVKNIVVKKFIRVSAGEMCSTDDTSPRQIWVVKTENSFAPGISYQYSVQDTDVAERTFDQILSTFKFLD